MSWLFCKSICILGYQKHVFHKLNTQIGLFMVKKMVQRYCEGRHHLSRLYQSKKIAA